MTSILLLAAGAVVGTAVVGLVASVSWYLETAIYEPLTNYDMARHTRVSGAISNFWSTFFSLLFLIPSILLSAVYGVVTNVATNLFRLAFLVLFLLVGLGIMQYHHEIYRAELIISQCIVMPFCNHFLFPLLNIARICFNAGIILWDFAYDLYAFYEWGPVIVFIKCTIHTSDATDMFGYLTNIFLVFSQDLTAWFSAGFLTADLDIVNTLDAFGLFIQTLVSPLTCLCRALDFIYKGAAMWFRLPSLHYALSCLLNFFIKLAQIPINTLMFSPHRPNFEEATLRACCVLGQTATTLEYTVLLIVEIFWGVFTNVALPLTIRRVLSVRWVHIFSEPLCGAARLVNMSLTAVVHYDELAQSTGIGYFQFGHVIDELKESAHYIASVFTLFNNDAQALVDQTLLVLLNAIAFVLEWVPGNIYYWLYGGPLPLYPSAPFGSFVNFLRYYFPDYWLKPFFDNFAATGSTYVYHTALDEFFLSTFMWTQALGNLIANLLGMEPLGGIIQHTLNILLCAVRVLVNMISFIFTIITFDSDIRTTFRKVDFDCIFNEMYFLAGSLGDFSRQFATPSNITGLICQVDADESQASVFCCFGNLIERFFDLLTIALQQSTHFVQDLVTLPTGNIIFCLAFLPYNHSQADRCLRTPDFSTAIYLLEASLCDFTCVLFSVIPMLRAFQCSFPLPPAPPNSHTPPEPTKPCGHINTCMAVLLCRLMRFLLVPLVVLNSLVAKSLGGASYQNYTLLGQFVLQIICDIIADSLSALGLLVNCTLCAFVGSGINCDDSIYQLLTSLGDLIRFLPMILNTLFSIVVKLVLVALIGLFTGDPIGAVIRFIVGVLTDLFGGLGTALINFLAKFFNAIGLGFIGDFIKILWRGFCPLLQLILNIIIVVLKVITFGAIQINFVNFCCDGSPDCQPSQRRRSDGQALSLDPNVDADGTLHVNLDNWIAATVQLVQWDAANPCNQSMSTYAGYAWNNLTEWEQNDVLYCLMKPYWNIRTDNQTVLANSTCDVMIMEYNQTSWHQVDVLSRRTIIDCMYSRIYVDAVRNGVGLPWLPSDILTNPYRKYVFGAEFARGLLIYWQYFSDKTATSVSFISPIYQNNWASMGLYTGFYANVTTPDQILQFRDHYRLVDYFAWNNATQYEAVEAVSIGFWNFSSHVLAKLSDVINAKSDNTLDPSSYLMYTYTLDSASSGITASFYGLIGGVISAAQNISAFWSNPVNVKKRSNAYEIAQAGGAGMWRSAVDQLTMMGIDYRMARLNESRYWAGNCSAAEGDLFMDEYDRWVRHDERSWAYHLSRWWATNADTMLTPHPIKNPRDGQRRIAYNQSQYLFSYEEPRTGREIGESGRQRINRLASALNTGSVRSNARWNALGRLLTLAKERLYVNVIRRNTAFAVDYINRVYVKGTTAAANEETVDATLLEEYYTATDAVTEAPRATDKVWQRATRRPKSAVEQQRLAAQHLHCGRAENKDDGFCQDYRVPPPKRDTPIYDTSATGATYRETAAYSRTGGRQYEIANRRAATVTAMSGQGHTPGVLWHPHSIVNSIRGSHFVGASMVIADSFIDLTCYTNITFDNSTLCDECFIVDQALGRVETGLAWVEEYYTGGQYQQSLNVSLNYFNYAADDTARVVVGDGPDLSVHGFPGTDGTWWYNLRYVGDDTPNKTRFEDVFAMIGAAVGDNTTTCNSTLGNGLLTFGGFVLDYYYLNGWVGYAVLLVVGGVVTVFLEVLAFFSGYQVGCGGSSDFGVFLIDWFFLCDWLTGEDFRGIRKRFSVGEMIVMFSVGWLAITLFTQITIGFSLLSLVAYSGTSVLVTFSFFRSISNNFSFLCLPGLDAMLADDMFYFLVYSFMSKCSWFLAFLIKNPEYDNETCTACANAGGWDILNCATERGFGDIFGNLIFMTQYYTPGALKWIRESQFPLISIFYQIPYVNQRINQFADVDMTDRATYAQYMGCNYIITLFWNFFFVVAFLYLLYVVGPIFYGLALVLVALANLVYSFYVMFNLICQDTFVSRATAPFTTLGLVDTPVAEHVDEVESERPDDGYRFTTDAGTNYSAPRQMRTRYTYDSHSVFNFSTLYNVSQRMWDNLFQTDRKRR